MSTAGHRLPRRFQVRPDDPPIMLAVGALLDRLGGVSLRERCEAVGLSENTVLSWRTAAKQGGRPRGSRLALFFAGHLDLLDAYDVETADAPEVAITCAACGETSTRPRHAFRTVLRRGMFSGADWPDEGPTATVPRCARCAKRAQGEARKRATSQHVPGGLGGDDERSPRGRMKSLHAKHTSDEAIALVDAAMTVETWTACRAEDRITDWLRWFGRDRPEDQPPQLSKPTYADLALFAQVHDLPALLRTRAAGLLRAHTARLGTMGARERRNIGTGHLKTTRLGGRFGRCLICRKIAYSGSARDGERVEYHLDCLARWRREQRTFNGYPPRPRGGGLRGDALAAHLMDAYEAAVRYLLRPPGHAEHETAEQLAGRFGVEVDTIRRRIDTFVGDLPDDLGDAKLAKWKRYFEAARAERARDE